MGFRIYLWTVFVMLVLLVAGVFGVLAWTAGYYGLDVFSGLLAVFGLMMTLLVGRLLWIDGGDTMLGRD